MKDTEQICESIDYLAKSVRRIASGENSPDGLEAVAMSIGGEGLKSSLAGAVENQGQYVSSSLDGIATALGEVAACLTMTTEADILGGLIVSAVEHASRHGVAFGETEANVFCSAAQQVEALAVDARSVLRHLFPEAFQ